MGSTGRLALALVGFSVLTVAVFHPTPYELVHTVPTSRGDAGDALLLIWATSHVSRALFTDPLGLFHAPIFHPEPYTLAFGDHMIGEALIGLPVWVASRNPLLEFNLLSLASYALGATAMFAYARIAVGRGLGALAAAIVFAFTPYRFHHPLWLQVLFTPFMPLTLLFWVRFIRELRWSDWALWVACWVAHSLMGMYLALYFALTMGALVLFALAAAPTRRTPRLRAGSLLAPLVALALLAPTLWPYLHLRTVQGQVRTFGLDTSLAFFLPGAGTPSAWFLGTSQPGRHFGPGLVAWVVSAVGIVAAGRRARAEGGWRAFLGAAHGVGLAVTLLIILTPIRFQLALPGLDMLRNTNRAFFVSLLFLAVFAAEAVAALERHGARLAAAAVAIALLLDMGTPPPRERKPMPVGEEVPPVYRWLAALPPGGVLYEGSAGVTNPTLAMYLAIFPMYYSIFHRQRLAEGYSGFAGAGGAYVTVQLARFPDPEALRLANAIGVRHVLWHFPRPELVDTFIARLPHDHVRMVARFDTDVVFRLDGAPPPPPTAALTAPLPRAAWRLTASAAAASLDVLRDGDPRTVWRVENLGATAPPRLTVDLGRPWPVAGVRCVPPEANAPGIYLADLELSTDGERWEPSGVWFKPASLDALLYRPRALTHYEARFPTREARYLRLTSAAIVFPQWPWEIAELEVDGDCAAARMAGCPPANEPRLSE